MAGALGRVLTLGWVLLAADDPRRGGADAGRGSWTKDLHSASSE